MNRSNKEIVRLVCEEVYGKGNVALVDELFVEDYVNLNPTPGLPAGREGIKIEAAGMYQAFSDMQATLEETVAEGDRIVARYRVRGVHTGDLMGIPATGKSVDVAGISIVRIVGGKVAEEFSLFDMASMMQQLGLAPEMG